MPCPKSNNRYFWDRAAGRARRPNGVPLCTPYANTPPDFGNRLPVGVGTSALLGINGSVEKSCGDAGQAASRPAHRVPASMFEYGSTLQ
jgi:hypothetical protein